MPRINKKSKKKNLSDKSRHENTNRQTIQKLTQRINDLKKQGNHESAELILRRLQKIVAKAKSNQQGRIKKNLSDKK